MTRLIIFFLSATAAAVGQSGKIAIVDTEASLCRESLRGDSSGGLEIDQQSRRVFANIAQSNEVVVIDPADKNIGARWKLSKAADNVPMAYDSEDKVLYTACRKPGTLIV